MAPSSPRLPAGACDCHAHVFGPYERFPLAANRTYSPPPASLENFVAMLDAAGLTRAVLVQPSAYGFDHRAITGALARARTRLRGIAAVDANVTDSTLADLHACGIRGARITEKLDASGGRFAGSVGMDQFDALAPRLRELRWQIHIWGDCDRLHEIAPQLTRAGLPVVLDHMGSFDVSRGVRDPAFQWLLQWLQDGQIWIKLSALRNSKCFPDYEDVRPFHDALLRANPDRLVWGSDWPFLRMGAATPEVRHLLHLLDAWIGDADLLQKILVDNPAALFGFS
jgi:predicted TIM-barrel fold metal-dependent hydrolase